jgi:hypothetical protein
MAITRIPNLAGRLVPRLNYSPFRGFCTGMHVVDVMDELSICLRFSLFRIRPPYS